MCQPNIPIGTSASAYISIYDLNNGPQHQESSFFVNNFCSFGCIELILPRQLEKNRNVSSKNNYRIQPSQKNVIPEKRKLYFGGSTRQNINKITEIEYKNFSILYRLYIPINYYIDLYNLSQYYTNCLNILQIRSFFIRSVQKDYLLYNSKNIAFQAIS